MVPVCLCGAVAFACLHSVAITYIRQNVLDCRALVCAGTVAGQTYGVAKAAKIVSVRVLGCDGTAPVGSALKGFDWVVQNHKSADGPSEVYI